MSKEKFEVEIEVLNVAESSDGPLEDGVEHLVDAEPMHDVELTAIETSTFSDGHIRRKWYRGVCYCQMHCGGQWLYFYKTVSGRRVFKTCGGSGWTVDCNGNTYILSC